MNNNSILTKVIYVVTKKVEQWIYRYGIYKIEFLCLILPVTHGVCLSRFIALLNPLNLSN
jgi:hypothetical protein